ncbi:uncharacterized protein VTP21DRAFT_4563 [Calcarisporiella thermophila]|uniref:uncharacterized protein n=1 Tax=Calcarisporiella thermophila TaxID=911321 RepID=UPI0037437160
MSESLEKPGDSTTPDTLPSKRTIPPVGPISPTEGGTRKRKAESNEVMEFLSRLGLEIYCDRFLEEGFEELPSLYEVTEEDLVEMRVKRGHRRLIQLEIAKVRKLPSPSLQTYFQTKFAQMPASFLFSHSADSQLIFYSSNSSHIRADPSSLGETPSQTATPPMTSTERADPVEKYGSIGNRRRRIREGKARVVNREDGPEQLPWQQQSSSSEDNVDISISNPANPLYNYEEFVSSDISISQQSEAQNSRTMPEVTKKSDFAITTTTSPRSGSGGSGSSSNSATGISGASGYVSDYSGNSVDSSASGGQEDIYVLKTTADTKNISTDTGDTDSGYQTGKRE